jgi:hypothetical protein
MVKCPKCGNKDYFVLVLNYLRLNVERDPLDGYVANWDEGECKTAYCAICYTELQAKQAEYLYAHSDIK